MARLGLEGRWDVLWLGCVSMPGLAQTSTAGGNHLQKVNAQKNPWVHLHFGQGS